MSGVLVREAHDQDCIGACNANVHSGISPRRQQEALLPEGGSLADAGWLQLATWLAVDQVHVLSTGSTGSKPTA